MFRNTKKWIPGILLLVCSYGFIAWKLIGFEADFDGYFLNILDSPIFLLVLILSVFNILAEAVKWQMLISYIKPVSLQKSVGMVLAGFTSGIFTPSKLGEPVGRVMSLPKEDWAKATLLNYFSGFLQNVVLLLMGFVFIGIMQQDGENIFRSVFYYSLLLLVFCLCMAVFIGVYKNRIWQRVQHFRILNKLLGIGTVLKEIKPLVHGKLMLLSLVRYILYCSQLILLLMIFTQNNHYSEFVLLAPIYFMCITMVPSFVLADLGVRNSVGILLFSTIQVDEVAVVLSVSLLYVINQIVPALLGSASILHLEKKRPVS